MKILILKLIGLVANNAISPDLVFSIIILGVILMAKKLTAGVLQGTAYKETMQVEWMGQDYEIEIRALSNSEANEVEALMQEGIKINSERVKGGRMERVMDFDTKENLFGRNKSDIKAVALGTTDKSITEKVVENEFPPKLVREIGQRIKQVTGIRVDSQVEDFNDGKDSPKDSDSK